MAEYILYALTAQALEHGCIVQVLTVLYDFDDFHVKSCGHSFFDIFNRSPAKGRGMNKHRNLWGSAFMIFHHIFSEANHLGRV